MEFLEIMKADSLFCEGEEKKSHMNKLFLYWICWRNDGEKQSCLSLSKPTLGVWQNVKVAVV